MNKRYCPLPALRIFVYQLVVLRVIRQKYFVFEGSGGKSRENVKLFKPQRTAAPPKGTETRKGGGCDGRGRGKRAAKWLFLHGFLLLLKAHGGKSPHGLSKCLPRSLTEIAGREMPVWGNALVRGSSEEKTTSRLQGDRCPGPTYATELPHHQQDTNWAFVSFSSALPLSIFACVCILIGQT